MAYIEKFSAIKSQRLAEQRLRFKLLTLAPNSVHWSRLTKEQIEHQWLKIKFNHKHLYQLEIRPALEEGNIYWLEFISHKSSKSVCNLQRDEQ